MSVPVPPSSGSLPLPLARVIDLDAYRKRRTEEGTWPPDEKAVKDYWRARVPKKKPEYDKVGPKPPDNGPKNEPPDRAA